MNLHEYQGKSILKSFGVRIQEGLVAASAEEAVAAAKKLQEETGTGWWVVKAQIHAGGRGKGKIIGSEQRGVALAKSLDEVKTIASNILGGTLVTLQTGEKGKLVSKVLVAQDVYYPGASEPSEFYMSVLLNRQTGRNMIMYSTEGGMDIETVAEQTPHLIFKEEIDPKVGLMPFQARKVAYNLGLSGVALKEMAKFVTSLYKAYEGCDASMFEINPVLKTSDDMIMAVDSKVTLDGNSLFRHPDYAAMRDVTEEDPTEVEADKFSLNYVKLDGSIGCMVNGAGLAMATMDIIKQFGEEPANFLDLGGTANKDRVIMGFKTIQADPNVKSILINIFGGIIHCDMIANGIVDAVKELDFKLPLVIRFQGTNASEGRDVINNSSLGLISIDDFTEAAKKVVELAKK